MAADVRIEEATGGGGDARRLLVELTLEEQAHYDHPQESPAELERRLTAAPHFSGENHILIARGEQDRPLGLCWVVLFDPGTGLEAEIAELYVRPEARRRGVATALVDAAMRFIRERQVTFAAVWTRHDNHAALAAYRSAGFAPTDQAVLTWLPLPERREPG